VASSYPRVGVVTVTYNSGVVLEDFLDSIAAQTGVEVYLYAIDNASSDGSVAALRAESRIAHLDVVANSDNLGVAEGNNQGIERALRDNCDWVFLLNNDTRFGPTTIADLVRDASENSLDIVSPLIEATEPASSVWYSGGHFVEWQGFRTFHDNSAEPIETFPRERVATGYASTCALLIRPDVFEKVGVMDPDYFVYFDDVDFAVRSVRAGYQYWVSPAALILHKASSLTGGKSSPFTLRWYTRNWALISRKHLGPVRSVIALAFIQTWMLARLAVRRDSVETYALRQRAFREGFRAGRSSAQVPTPTAASKR
jgi:GT2 family glycosyltransferase